MNCQKTLLAFLCFLAASVVYAAVPEWQMVPEESSITFTGVQNNAPATGSFKKFTGDIHLDSNQLKDSHVRIDIDMNSVTTTYSDFTSTLLTPDWFNVKLFPHAIFEGKNFKKIADNKYQVDGTLTVKDKTVPVSITFTSTDLSNAKGRVTGSTTVKRTALGVGLGEWTDTDSVKDDVQVNFVITAIKK